LNLEGTSVNWAGATPNLRDLTNNGVILLPNEGVFGSPAAPYGALINAGEIEDLGAEVWAGNFADTGSFLNTEGSFTLDSQTALATNSILYATGDMSITTGSLITSNLELEADRSLTLTVTNLLTDDGVTNGSTWFVGDASIGDGLSLPVLPASANLLGTTIYDYAPTNRTTANEWAGSNDGGANAGYTNNAAIGQLILDPLGPGPLSKLYFTGAGAPGVTNAIYVDRLVLAGYASYLYHSSSNSIPSLGFNNNLIIYYADAIDTQIGGDVSFQLNGFNGGHLIWVPSYIGYFSGTNILYPNGTTNTFNAGLVDSTVYDSDAAGTIVNGKTNYVVNSENPTPFFVSSEMAFAASRTNHPANAVAISWNTIPHATNFVYYSTNLLSWQILTNSYLLTNPFVTPAPYPGPTTNIMVLDPVGGQERFYKVIVNPDLFFPYQ
jgi:hypothetical protein